jgi:integrase
LIGKGNRSAIATLVERTTGYVLLVALPEGYKAEQVAPALAAKIKTLPDSLRRSLTWDQGPEMRDWKQIRIDANIGDLFLRSALSLAAWHQREHQRAAAPVLSQGHRARRADLAPQPGIRCVHKLDDHRERFRGLIDLIGGEELDEHPLFVRLGRHGDQDPLPLSAVAVHRLVRRCCLAAGVPERLAHPHALRAYWATHLLEA